MAERGEILANMRTLSHGNLAVPVLLLAILAMVTLPVPPFILDGLFTFNIALSLVVLLVSVYTGRPLDFAVFPTILLVATLLRLALNVASTRVVLLNGHTGGDAAGKVIQAFGEVVVGGNYVVGMVVFVILVIINFVVVTKGAGRISEVSARFTLDAMPGKQMAIDADMNSGLIDQDEARLRRSEIAQEADFYGSMDGASKFVRGDAVAGILILLINILCGLGIGMLQHDLPFGTAMRLYALLTIGDGLVAQIPSLLLSTATAIIVTRVSTTQDMGNQVVTQMFESPRSLAMAAVILGIMGSIPGMPHVAFLGLAAIAGGMAWLIFDRRRKAEAAEQAEVAAETAAEAEKPAEGEIPELGWDDVQPVDVLGLEVGYRLIPLVDKNQNGQLLSRIKGVRKKLSQELGFLMPSVHIRDNLDLAPNAYRITLMGVRSGSAEVYPERELAINPGQVFGKIQGTETKDPAFGMEAVWIDPEQREQAQTLGYTVVDASTVVATHLNQVMHKHAHELIGHEEVGRLLEMLGRQSPKLAEQFPEKVPVNVLLKVLQNLLSEGIPVRDIRTIAEAIVEAAQKSQDPGQLTAAVRIALSRLIAETVSGGEETLPVITLEPDLEQLLVKSIHQSRQAGAGEETVALEPGMAERLQKSLNDAARRQEVAGKPAILLVAAPIRAMLARFVRYGGAQMHVLSYQEVPDDRQITIVATVGQDG